MTVSIGRRGPLRFPGLRVAGACAGLVVFFLLSLCCGSSLASSDITAGNVRIQLLSDSLVRLELKGPEGFENRNTFHVVNRNWPGAPFAAVTNAGQIIIRTARYVVRIPQSAGNLNGVRVESPDGRTLYEYDGKLENNRWLPGPEDNAQVWWFADTPRIIPPSRGLTPGPNSARRAGTSGWDLSNNAPDVYVFVPSGIYFTLRTDFLKLTGPTEMPPLFAFGAFDSRWYDYSESTALKQIDDYRAHRIPLDVLVVDTGWRRGASTGYQPNTNLFPEMKRFFREAHAKDVRVMFNDHPEPVTAKALDPAELDYRYDNLSKLLNEGLDFWWYDRNWMVHLATPAPNLNKEVWGMRLYHDITARVRPKERPLIMANVDGIDNGLRKRSMDVAAHRFPIQWTGDIGPGYDFLRRAVENAVYSGVQSLFPYESDDLGGHVANPTTDEYIRWIEYGALSPVYRPHCTHNLERMPWVFGPQAENVARRFLNMRYRLLPVFYAAAHENYQTGEPLLRRLDLDYPEFREAARNDEYLLGKYILVAPVLQGSLQIVPGEWLKTPDGRPGLQADYFTNENVSGAPAFDRTDAGIDFNWDEKSPAPDFPRTHFSVRWTGVIEVPASVGDIKLATLEDDGARVWIDDKLVIDAWGPHDSATTESAADLAASVPHRIRIEYLQLDYGAHIKLLWRSATTSSAVREAWIPPGDWIDAWSGKVASGPARITNDVPLGRAPVWIKSGAVLPLAPEMRYTGERPWNPVMLDLYPRANETNRADLYEDDTVTTAYRRGRFRRTIISVTDKESANSAVVGVDLSAAKGTYRGALGKRAWIVRIHPAANWPRDWKPTGVRLNGKAADVPVSRVPRAENAMPLGDPTGAPDSDVFEINLPSAAVSGSRSIEISFGS